jgi:hypothetical protein
MKPGVTPGGGWITHQADNAQPVFAPVSVTEKFTEPNNPAGVEIIRLSRGRRSMNVAPDRFSAPDLPA